MIKGEEFFLGKIQEDENETKKHNNNTVGRKARSKMKSNGDGEILLCVLNCII